MPNRKNKTQPLLTHKPVTLYVNTVDFEPSFESLIPERIAQVDLEFDKETIKIIIERLTQRIQENLDGTIRVRFTGRMVH